MAPHRAIAVFCAVLQLEVGPAARCALKRVHVASSLRPARSWCVSVCVRVCVRVCERVCERECVFGCVLTRWWGQAAASFTPAPRAAFPLPRHTSLAQRGRLGCPVPCLRRPCAVRTRGAPGARFASAPDDSQQKGMWVEAPGCSACMSACMHVHRAQRLRGARPWLVCVCMCVCVYGHLCVFSPRTRVRAGA